MQEPSFVLMTIIFVRCLGWTIHHCNSTPMWRLISLQVLIEHLSQLAWMPTYGTAIRDFRHQTAVYLESL